VLHVKRFQPLTHINMYLTFFKLKLVLTSICRSRFSCCKRACSSLKKIIIWYEISNWILRNIYLHMQGDSLHGTHAGSNQFVRVFLSYKEFKKNVNFCGTRSLIRILVPQFLKKTTLLRHEKAKRLFLHEPSNKKLLNFFRFTQLFLLKKPQDKSLKVFHISMKTNNPLVCQNGMIAFKTPLKKG